MNLDEFSYEEDGRRYINPQVALDEQNAFIQNLRDTQQTRNAQIAQDTHNLGTDVPSNIGGLNGSEAYFNARYQTPQTNYTIANIRAAAQSQALTDVMNNELNKAKKRYSDAYKAAVTRANTPATTNNNGGDGGGKTPTTPNNDVVQNDEGKNPIGDIGFDNGATFYSTGLGRRYYLGNVPQGVAITAPFMQSTVKQPANGTVREYNGKKYLFVNTSRSNGPKWYQITGDFAYNGR